MRWLLALLLLSFSSPALARGSNAASRVIFDANQNIPINQLQTYGNVTGPCTHFGSTSKECAFATEYFAGYNNYNPASISFMNLPSSFPSGPGIYGADVSTLTLSQLQAINGPLNVMSDGALFQTNVNLSAATSFTSAATIIRTAFNGAAPQTGVVQASIAPVTISAFATVDAVEAHLNIQPDTGTLPPIPDGANVCGTADPSDTPCLSTSVDYIGQIVALAPYAEELIPVYPVPPSSTYQIVCSGTAGTIGCPPGTAAGAVTVPQWQTSGLFQTRSRIASVSGGNGAGNVVLTLTQPLPTPTNFVTGFWYSIWNTGTDPVTGLNNQWQITVNDSTHITLQNSSAATTAGFVPGNRVRIQGGGQPINISYGAMTISSLTSGKIEQARAATGTGITLAHTRVGNCLSGCGTPAGSVWAVNNAQTVALGKITLTASPLAVIWVPQGSWGNFQISHDQFTICDAVTTAPCAMQFATGAAAAKLGLAVNSGGLQGLPYTQSAVAAGYTFVQNLVSWLQSNSPGAGSGQSCEPSFGGQPSMAQTIHYWAQATAPTQCQAIWPAATTPAAAAYTPYGSNFNWTISLPIAFNSSTNFTFRGTETRAFEWMQGSLYAAISDWKDPQLDNPSAPGAQILRLDCPLPTCSWQTDLALGQLQTSGTGPNPGNKQFQAIGNEKAVEFDIDRNLVPLNPPVHELLASVWNRGAGLIQFQKIGGAWEEVFLKSYANAPFATNTAQIRTYAEYIDTVTHQQMVFAGTDPFGIYSGVYDSTVGDIVWSTAAPEAGSLPSSLPNQPGNANPRVMAMAACNGRLYATIYDALMVRTDGPSPSWAIAYELPSNFGLESGSSGWRGLTCVANPSGSGPPVLLAYLEHNPGTGWTFPTSAPYTATQEVNFNTLFTNTVGVQAGYGIEAYNNTTLYPYSSGSACPDILVGFTMGTAAFDDDVGIAYPNAQYVIRHCNGSYDNPRMVGDETQVPAPALESVRTLTVSQFPSDAPGTIYVGGYDGGYKQSVGSLQNTNWIYRGAPVGSLVAASPPPPVTPVVTPPNLSACDFTLPTTFAHVWYIDPVNGKTQNAMTAAHISLDPTVTPHQGDINNPWNSANALWNSISESNSLGYPLPLIPGAIIKGGDEVLLQNGTAAQYGAVTMGISGGFFYNTTGPYVVIQPAPGATVQFASLIMGSVHYVAFKHINIRNAATAWLLQDGPGSAKNNVFDSMDISTTDPTTAQSWTQAQWAAASGGVRFNVGPCVSVTNSHIYNVATGMAYGGGGQNIFSNNQIDHVSEDAVDMDGSDLVFTHNSIHDFPNAGVGDHIDAVQGVLGIPEQPTSNRILIDSNTIIWQLDPNLPFPTGSAIAGAIAWGGNAGDWTSMQVTNNKIYWTNFIHGISFSGTTDGIIENNTLAGGFIRPSGFDTNVLIKNNLSSGMQCTNGDQVGVTMQNNVLYQGGSSINIVCFGGVAVTISGAAGTYLGGNIVDSGGVLSEITAANGTTLAFDFHLLSTAPARGAGTTVDFTPQIDSLGFPLNTPPDVGAIQYPQ